MLVQACDKQYTLKIRKFYCGSLVFIACPGLAVYLNIAILLRIYSVYCLPRPGRIPKYCNFTADL